MIRRLSPLCPAAIGLLSLLLTPTDLTAAEVRRIVLPEVLTWTKGAPGPVTPISGAQWLAVPEAPLPKGGLFLKFRATFPADGHTPLRFHVTADERFVLMLDGRVIARGPDRADPTLWFFQTYETQPEHGDHTLEAVVWKTNPGQPPNAQLSHHLGFILAAEGAFAPLLTTGRAN